MKMAVVNFMGFN